MTREFVTLPREVVEHVLKAMGCGGLLKQRQAMAALHAALELPQVEQKPVGKLISDPYEGHIFVPYGDRWPFNEDLYTHPQPNREPLTDEQIAAATGAKPGTPTWLVAVAFTRAVEAAHNIK